jgi:hypothetical protein
MVDFTCRYRTPLDFGRRVLSSAQRNTISRIGENHGPVRSLKTILHARAGLVPFVLPWSFHAKGALVKAAVDLASAKPPKENRSTEII